MACFLTTVWPEGSYILFFMISGSFTSFVSSTINLLTWIVCVVGHLTDLLLAVGNFSKGLPSRNWAVRCKFWSLEFTALISAQIFSVSQFSRITLEPGVEDTRDLCKLEKKRRLDAFDGWKRRSLRPNILISLL